MYDSRNMALYNELFKTAHESVGPVVGARVRGLVKEGASISPEVLKLLLAGGAGVAAGAIPTYLAKNHVDEGRRLKTRNRAFGAGLATGVAAPKITRGLFNIAKRTGFLPEDPAGAQFDPSMLGGLQ